MDWKNPAVLFGFMEDDFFTASRFVIFFMSDCFVVRRVSEHHAQCLVIDTPQDVPYGPSCGR